MGAPFALDMGTVMAIGAARGVDLALLSEILPAAEVAILSGHDGGGVEDEED